MPAVAPAAPGLTATLRCCGDTLVAEDFPQIRAQVEGIVLSGPSEGVAEPEAEPAGAASPGNPDFTRLPTERPKSEQGRAQFGVLRALDERGNVWVTGPGGVCVFDPDGNRYLDGLSSLFCCQIGYSFGEEMASVAGEQLSTLAFNTNWGTAHPPAIRLAAALADQAKAHQQAGREASGQGFASLDEARAAVLAPEEQADLAATVESWITTLAGLDAAGAAGDPAGLAPGARGEAVFRLTAPAAPGPGSTPTSKGTGPAPRAGCRPS